MLSPEEHPFPVGGVSRFDTLYVETGRFLRQLMRDIQIAGGRFAIRSFAAPAEIAALPERLVFNCTGLGARALFGDTELQPVRGQLAILARKSVVSGKSVSIRVALGGRRIIKNKNHTRNTCLA